MSVNFLKAHCLNAANTTPIIFLHGFLGTFQDFTKLASYLKEFHCIGIDLPGHGDSAFTPNFSQSMPFFQKMHLVGYSMGGRLALQYAKVFPEKIATLTILSAHCGLATGHEKRWQEDLKWAQKIREDFDGFLQEWYAQELFAGFIPDLSMRKKQNPEALAKTLLHYSLAKQECFSIKNSGIIVGEKDTKYQKLYPNASIVQKAGHMVHLENPRIVAQLIKQRIYELDKR